MRAIVFGALLLVVPSLAAAQEEPALEVAAPAGVTESPGPVAPLLPASALDVAYVQGVAGLMPGARVEAGRAIELPVGGCLRLVAGDRAGVTLCGPARARVEAAGPEALAVIVDTGRGVLVASEPGVSIVVAGRPLVVAGVAAFDAGAAQVAWLLSGTGTFDGAALVLVERSAAPADLGRPSLCAPPRSPIVIRLGDPSAVVASARERHRSRGEDGESSSSSAESSATCVDSADGSSASDPSQGGEGGVDPDARRDAGRVRVVIDVPWRTR